MNPTAARRGSTFVMRSAAFAFLLMTVTAASVWLGLRLIITTDPDSIVNLLLFEVALFLAAGSVGALCAWAVWARRRPEPKGYQIALRQGVWVGLIVALSGLLQMWQMLSLLALGALLLVFGGLEALLLLQAEPRKTSAGYKDEGAPARAP